MLPKNQRLTKGQDYKRVYQKGSFFSGPYFSLNWISNKTRVTRIGFVVGKKITKKATDRNTLKRRYREVARKIYSEIPQGIDLVIVIKEKSQNLKFPDIESQIKESLQKIK